MKLVKERARAPIIENGSYSASQGFDAASRQGTFTLTCNGPWQQGKGHESSYTVHLSKTEMLQVVSAWTAALSREESRAVEAAALKTAN
jgi:hypothetical protein